MRKFTTIRKIYEREETLSNLPQNVGMQNDTVIVTTSVETTPDGTQSNIEPQTTTVEQTQPEIVEEPKKTSTVVSLFSKLFESREMAHIYHLQVNGEQGSLASHLALGSYYDNINELLDMMLEVYSAQYGIVDGYDIIDTKDTRTKDKLEYFIELIEFIKHARKCILLEDTHLHNIIDEIVTLIYRTIYKLKFLK